MAKRDWRIRWEDTLKEKLIRFNMSCDRPQLSEWLKNVGISVKFDRYRDYTEFDLGTNEEIGKALSLEKCPYKPKSRKALLWRWRKWKKSEDYGHFMDACIKAGKKYGFRWQTIFEALFLPLYEVRIETLIKPEWFLEPIFPYTDEKIMNRIEGKLPPGTAIRWYFEESAEELELSNIEAYNIFKVVVEFPPDYPSEGTLEMAREAAKAARTLCKALGRPIKERQKSKPILQDAERLRLGQTLPSGEVYSIIDEIYGDDLTNDREKRKRIISRRHKGKKYLSDR